MNKLNSILTVALLAITFTACKKDEDSVIVVPPSGGSMLTLEGKTVVSAYANVVYVDLSADKQTPVDRKSWALGFYSGADFKVVLNHSFQALAVVVNKNDMNAVTLDDAKASLVYNINLLSPILTNAISLVDYYDGSLSRTAIASVSATDAENKVYILGLNGIYTQPNLYKIRVLRNGINSYALQYAKVEETIFKTVTIAKNVDYNLTLVSFGNNNDGVMVKAEPKKIEWDFQWNYGTFKSDPTNIESNPYWYQDMITINNLAGVQAVEVKTSTVSYAAFSEANLAGLVFSSARDAIGSKWRISPGMAGVGGGVNTNVFYLVKDSSGNVYKLKFNSYITGDGGERGRPVIEYKLVKKG